MKKQNMAPVYAVLVICIVAMIIVLYLALTDAISVIAAGFLEVFLGIIFYATTEEKKKRNLKDAEDYHKIKAYYDESSKELIIEERNPAFTKVLQIKPFYADQTDYTPEQLVYTGATVGGVTTGGFHKEGGYNTRSMKTSKSMMLYEYLVGEGIRSAEVEKIRLNNALLQEASASGISKYLKGNTIQVCEDQKSNPLLVDAAKAGCWDIGANMIANEETRRHPTKEKCQEIINWLCGTQS